MTTALVLVNRVRRKMRESDMADVTDDLSVAILDEVNAAMAEVLDTRIWDFDVRSASLITQPTADATDFDITQATAAFTATLDSITNLTIAGNYSWRVSVTNASFHGETSFVITGGTLAASVLSGNLDQNWPDTSTSSAGTAEFFVPEYQFPQHSDDGYSQVRQLLSMTYQERQIELRQVSRQDFDRVVTRPHDSLGTEPLIAYTGFDVLETGTNASAGTDWAPGFGIWPVPDDAVRLDYTYVFSHPVITSSQELEEVPRSVEDQIVWLAYARIMQGGVGNEPQAGVLLEQRVLTRLRDLYAGQKRDPTRHMNVRPHYGRAPRGVANFGVIPRDVGSL